MDLEGGLILPKQPDGFSQVEFDSHRARHVEALGFRFAFAESPATHDPADHPRFVH
jgi:hypothetical protein